jgi:hypothetical protein
MMIITIFSILEGNPWQGRSYTDCWFATQPGRKHPGQSRLTFCNTCSDIVQIIFEELVAQQSHLVLSA